MEEDSLKFAWDTDTLKWGTNYLKFEYEERPSQYASQQVQPQIIYVPQQTPQTVYIPQQPPSQIYTPPQPTPSQIPVYPTKNDSTAVKVIKTVCIIGVILLILYAIFVYDPSIGENLINSFKNIINNFVNYPHV